MRALRLAAAFLAILASPQLAPPAGAVSSSGFNLSCSAAAAGSDVNCTVTRTTGGKGLYVLFQTSDGTAHAGTDYTAVSQLLYFRASAVTQTVAIHTAVNRAAVGTLTFGVAIAVGNVPVRATGSIVEPAVVVPPPPATQTCPDGSVILATAVCPAPPAPPAPPPVAVSWVPAPLVVGGYAFLRNQGGCCNGVIVRLVARPMSSDAVPVPIWLIQFDRDTNGDPLHADYWRTVTAQENDSNLQGVAPAQ